MDSPDDNEIRRRPSGQLPKRKTVDTISSLDEAWLHTLDRGVGDSPINEVILPLMRDCFFLADRCTPFYCCRRATRPAHGRYCALHYARAGVAVKIHSRTVTL